MSVAVDSTQLPEALQVKLSEREWVETFAPESYEIVRRLHKKLTQKRAKLVARIDKAFAAIDAESTNEDYRYFWKAAFHAKYKLDEELRDVDIKIARQRRYLTIINDKPLPVGAINAELIQAAKDVPIESIFDQQFRQTGNKLVGICPFHEEKTASFFIYKDTNRCYCFSCKAGYNTIDSYMRLHDCNFNEAVLTLTGSEV
jgi:DNA primase